MTGIYCIETKWDADGGVSVKKPLSFVAGFAGVTEPKHCTVGSPEDFDGCLRAWANRTDWDYPILYLAFHGFGKGVQVGGGESSVSLWDYVRLEQIADFSEGGWAGCLIHFAACSTMDAPTLDIARFVADTGIEAVSGYATDVDWIPSMAFELMYLDTVLSGTGSGYVDRNKMRICRDRLSNSAYSKELATSLGFRMAIKGD